MCSTVLIALIREISAKESGNLGATVMNRLDEL